jgi:hypothetical protein
MKRILGYALILGSLAVPAFAAKDSQSLTLATPVTVGSTLLSAGNYKVTWTGSGPAVQVTIAQKGKASVSVAARLVDANNDHVAIVTNSVNGATVLQTIELNKSNLVLTGAAAQGE